MMKIVAALVQILTRELGTKLKLWRHGPCPHVLVAHARRAGAENGERRSEKSRFIGTEAQSIFFMQTTDTWLCFWRREREKIKVQAFCSDCCLGGVTYNVDRIHIVTHKQRLVLGRTNTWPLAVVASSRNLRPAFLRDDYIKFVSTSRVHCVYCKPNNLRQALIHNRFIHSRCLGDLLPIRSLSTVLSVKPEAADLGVTVMDFSYFSALTDLVVYVDFTYLLFSNYSW